MARIAFTRQNIKFRLFIMLLSCSFISGCGQGPKAFFANAWNSGKNGASSLAQKISPRKKKTGDEEALADTESGNSDIKTVSGEDSDDKTGSVFSAWIRGGTKQENLAADPFINQSWVKRAQKENLDSSNDKVINVSRETTGDNPISLNEDLGSRNHSELDKLLEGIGTTKPDPIVTDTSVKNNEFVEGIDDNLEDLRKSLQEDTDLNNQLALPEKEQNKEALELVERKMILAETFLVKGDIESAKLKAMEAQEIVERENLDLKDNSPSFFLEGIASSTQEEEVLVIDQKKEKKTFDDLVLNEKPSREKPKAKTPRKESRFDLAFPYDSNNDGWESDGSFTSKDEFKQDYREADSFTQTIKPVGRANSGMIVDTETLDEREEIREDFKKAQKVKKKSSQILITPADDSWDTSLLKSRLKATENVVQSEQVKPEGTTTADVETGEARANASSEIRLASHEKNVLAPMAKAKVSNPVKIDTSKIEFQYAQEEDDRILEISDEEITLAPLEEQFLNDELLAPPAAQGQFGGTAYLVIAGLFILGFSFLIYRKLRKANLI